MHAGSALPRRFTGRGLLLAGLAVQAVLIAGFDLRAQPIRLTPPGASQPGASQPGTEQRPDTAAPAQDSTPPIGQGQPGAGQPSAGQSGLGQPGGIQTAPLPAPQPSTELAPPNGKAPAFVSQPLSAPDPAIAGLLDDGNGGLGATMWQGTSRAQAMQALGVLPAPVAASALRDLQRRLLLTTAQAPVGSGGTPSLLGLRVEQLFRLGQIAAAEQLGTPQPPDLKDPIFRQLPFEMALLKNDLAQACSLAASALREDASPYWQKAAVLCRYSAKDIAGGDLALSLWRDGGGGEDPAFNALAAALRGDARAKVESLGGASPLHFAMLRAAGRPLPKDTLDVAPPSLLVALAAYDKADAELRLSATERAVRYGALPAELLAEAYAAAEIPEAQRAALTAAIAGGKDKNARAAAFLYQSTKAANEPKARAELVRRAYDLAMARDLLLPTAAAYKPLLNNLVPNEASIPAAPAVIRMALAAGETGTARLWRNILMALPPERDNAGEIAAEAWPLLLIAGEDGEWRDSRYEAWLAAQNDLPVAQRHARAAQLLTLAEGAGIVVPTERWDSLLNAGAGAERKAPPVAVWRNLLRASEAKAKGETVALALALLGPNGSLDADGQSLATALGALRNVGMATEARQIALEAALLRGF
ncbi:hypothetical protein [Ferrovibrio sp.]|uniref:hypothetical protein n=1 Tax=Ferrovibrio sp. TaxID=1917215 RepID=UPI0035AFAAAC